MKCRTDRETHNSQVRRFGRCLDPGHLEGGPPSDPWARRPRRCVPVDAGAAWAVLAMICCVQEFAWAIVVTEWRLPITDGECWEEEAGSTIPQVLGFGSGDAAVAWAKWNADRQPDWHPWAMPSPTTSLDDFRLEWPVRSGDEWQ